MKTISRFRKEAILFMLLSVLSNPILAQGNGLSGIQEATSLITSYFDPGTRLMLAIGALTGLIGAVKVYTKFSNGDPDTARVAAGWFSACIFLVVAASILRSFFLS